jgi:acetyl esterase/lipase
VIYKLITILISGIGFFLSAWVILPAPIFDLLPLAIGAPEVIHWLWFVNILGGVLALRLLQGSGRKLSRGAIKGSAKSVRRNLQLAYLTLGLSSLGFLLSLLPIIQFPAANQTAQTELERSLGTHSLENIPSSQQAIMRPQPFVLKDALWGIPSLPVRYNRGVALGNTTGEPLALEVYRPPQEGKYPAIVIIHGGAWQGGSPRDNAEFSRYMAARGYVVWAITYRYAPKHKFPAQIEDVQTALRYIQKHALEYDTDLNRVALMGRSAGAHLAMLAAYDTPQPNTPSIRAVVNYYGPVDLTAGYDDLPSPDPINSRAILRDFLGGTPDQVGELYKAASPINYVDRLPQNGLPPKSLRQSPLPPSLLIYGGKDHIVMAKFGKALAQRLLASGSQAMFLDIPWADHSFDAVFSGISNQLALYYTERFLAITLD